MGQGSGPPQGNAELHSVFEFHLYKVDGANNYSVAETVVCWPSSPALQESFLEEPTSITEV